MNADDRFGAAGLKDVLDEFLIDGDAAGGVGVFALAVEEYVGLSEDRLRAYGEWCGSC